MDTTPGTLATRASAALTSARTGADLMVAPLVAWITTWSPSPDADGKLCVSRLTAACESVLGRLKPPPNALPSCVLAPITAIVASSQRPATHLRCAKHQRASLDMENLRVTRCRSVFRSRLQRCRRQRAATRERSPERGV